VKVAQYEVLGNGAKRHVRPARDDRNAWLLVSHAAQRLPPLVDRPVPPSSRRRFSQRLTQSGSWPAFTGSRATSPLLLNRVPAIDHEVGAIHHVAGIGSEKEGCCCDFLRISETAGRQFTLKFFAHFTGPRFFSKLG